MKNSTTSPFVRSVLFSGLVAAIVLVPAAHAADRFKVNNTTALNATGSWSTTSGGASGASVPGNADVGVWDSTDTASATPVLLGGTLTWDGIRIVSPTTPQTIGFGSTLTLDGGQGTDIDMSSAATSSADFTINCGLTLQNAQTWNIASGRTLTLGGTVAAGSTPIKSGSGTVLLNNTNNWTGNFEMQGGALVINQGATLTNTSEFWVGNASGQNSVVTNNGGIVSIGSWLTAGGRNGATGAVVNASGLMIHQNAGRVDVGVTAAGGVGRLIVNGGAFIDLATDTGIALPEGNGIATMNLNGGYLAARGVATGGGNGTNFFNGGVLQARNNSGVRDPYLQVTAAYISAGGLIFDDTANTININQTLLSDTITPSPGGSFTKQGLGVTSLKPTTPNSYSGDTIVNGGTLSLSFVNTTTPANGVISNATGRLIFGKLYNANYAGGGTLATFGKGSGTVNTQSFASVTLNAGGNTISNNLNGATSSALILGTVLRPANGGTVDFGTNGTAFISTTTSNNAFGIIGGWATDQNSDWAMTNASGIAPFTAFTGSLPVSGSSDSGNYTSPGVTLTASESANSLKATGGTLAMGANKLTLGSGNNGGLLVTAATTVTGDNSGNGSLGAGAGNEFIVFVKSGITLTINNTGSAIGNSNLLIGANSGGLTKSGSGSISFGFSSAAGLAYTGPTYVRQGTVALNNNIPTMSSSYIQIDAGASLTFGAAFTLGGSATQVLGGNGTFSSGTGLTMGPNFVLAPGGSNAFGAFNLTANPPSVSSGATFLFDLGNDPVNTNRNDQIICNPTSGNFTMPSGGTVNIVINAVDGLLGYGTYNLLTLTGQSLANTPTYNVTFPNGGQPAGYTIGYNSASKQLQLYVTNAANACVPPTPLAVTGGTNCADVGSTIGLSTSVSGVNYQLFRNGTVAVGAFVPGTGSSVTFGTQTTPGTYTVVATNTSGNCISTNTGNSVVAAVPTAQTVSGVNGCSSPGVTLGLNSSETGVSYQLYIGGATPVGSPVAGTGGAISFGLKTVAGTYTVKSVAAICGAVDMTGSVTITASPTAFNVTGGTNCADVGVTVGLDNSESGVDYQLYVGATPVGSPIPGNGLALNFGSQTTAGLYTIVASNTTATCTATMTGNAFVSPVPLAFSVTGGNGCSSAGVTIGLSGSQSGLSYQLYLDAAPTGSPVVGNNSTISFGSKTAAGTYTVKTVAAGCAAADMTGSVVITATPNAPTIGTATPGDAQVTVTWTAPGAGVTPTGYNVKRSTTSGSGYATVSGGANVSSSPFTDTTAVNGTIYYYVVSALNTATSTCEGVNSAQVTATPNPAVAAVSFAVQPTDAFSGSPISPAVQVLVKDAGNNPITNTPVTVTLTNGVTLNGTTTQLTGNGGIAIFANLSIVPVSNAYVMRATDGAVTADSTPFNVAQPPVSTIVVTLPGQTFTAGSGNSGHVTVQKVGTPFNLSFTAVDNTMNIVTAYTGSKTITYSGPSGSPTYTTTVNFTAGQVTGVATTLAVAEGTAIAVTDGTFSGTSSWLVVTPAAGTIYTKANNTSGLDVSGTYTVAGITTINDESLFETTYQQNANLGSGSTPFFGIKVNNPGFDVAIITGNAPNITGGGLDLSTATKDLTIAVGNDLNFGSAAYPAQTWNIAAGHKATVRGKIWPIGNTSLLQVTKTGAGTVAMGPTTGTPNSGGNAWGTSGFMKISQGTVQIEALNPNPFGGGTGPSVIMDGGTLQFLAAITLGSYPVKLTTNSGAIDVQSFAVTMGSVIQNFSTPAGFTKLGSAALTLTGNSTYGGATVIANGTLALSGSGALANTTNINIVGGATFSVSGRSSLLTLGASQTLQSSGSTSTATIAVGAGVGSLSLSSTTPLKFSAFTPAGAGGAVPITLSGAGTLTLGASSPVSVTVSNGGTPLALGSYKLIAKGAGTVTTVPGGVITVGGDGIAGGTVAALAISGGELYLNVLTPTVTVLDALSTVTYGTPVTFTATVTPTPVDGTTVTFKDGATVLGTGTTVSGVASYTTADIQLQAGARSITAVFAGDSTYASSTSSAATQQVDQRSASIGGGLTANNKVYNGNTVATLSSNSVILSGIVFSDFANVGVSTNGYTATFASPNVGTAIGVTVSGISITGISAGNYVLTQPTGLSADITAKSVTVASGLTAGNKPYDGTTVATLSSNNVVLSGVVVADAGNVSLNTNGYVATFAGANAGTGISVGVTGLTLDGPAVGNYALIQPTLSANITKAASSAGISSSLNPSGNGSSVSFTATLSGVTVPTGNVIFLTNGVQLSVNALGGGIATSDATSRLPRGTNTVEVDYAGDANFTSSTNSLLQVVTNAAPVANLDAYSRGANTMLKITISDLLTNDTDLENDTLTVVGAGTDGVNLTTTNGITLSTNATYIFYTNGPNVADAFQYTINDGFGGTATGTVLITIVTTNSTNSVVSLEVNVPGVASNTVTFAGIPGYVYGSQFSTNLTDWVDLHTNTAGLNGLWQVIDDTATNGSRFYRSVSR